MTAISIPTFDLEQPIESGGSLRIETLETEVRIRTVEGRLARVRLSDADFATEFRVDAAADRLRIRPARRWAFGWRRLRGPLDVEVPRDVRVEIDTASGSVLALDIVAGLAVRTASGDIELAGVGGEIRASAVSGATRVQAASSASLDLGSVSGRIDAVAASVSSVKARSTSGRIRLMAGLRGTGPFSLETVSGGITLGTDGPMRLLASTVSGDVRSDGRADDGSGRRTIATTGSGPEVHARTISGRIHVSDWSAETPGPATPPEPAAAASRPQPQAADAPQPSAADARGLPSDDRPQPSAADAPGLPSDDRPQPSAADAPGLPSDDIDETRLAVLQALARGEISVAEAGRRIDALEEVPR